MNAPVFVGSEKLRTWRTFPIPFRVPTVTASPEPFETAAVPAMLIASTPLNSVMAFGFATFAVAKPCWKPPPAGTMATPPPTKIFAPPTGIVRLPFAIMFTPLMSIARSTRLLSML